MRRSLNAMAVLVITVLAVLATSRITNAASPIDRGFVFIDGEYLNTPYVIEAHDLAVYVNGQQVTEPLTWPPLQKYLFDHDPGFPEGLTRNTSLKDALNVREPGGMLFDTAKQRYLFSHLNYEEAHRLMLDYYGGLPCVESMSQDADGLWILRGYDGTTLRLVLGENNIRRLNELYGPHGSGPPPLSEYQEAVDHRAKRLEERLGKGDLYLLFCGGREISYSEREAVVLLPEIIAILESASTEEKKLSELCSYGVFQSSNDRDALVFVRRFRNSAEFQERLNRVRKELTSTLGSSTLVTPKRDLDARTREAKARAFEVGPPREGHRGVAYSPDGLSIRAYCGYTYDPAFSMFDDLVANVRDHLKDQGFSSSVVRYTDTSGEDSDAETATYDNLKNLRYADLMYMTVHGSPGGSLFFILLKTEDDVRAWCNNDPLVGEAIASGEDWPTGHPYFATGSSNWASTYWKPMLDQSKAISILSCCYSHANGWADACGGAAVFGYDQTCFDPHNLSNDDELLSRMNGTTADGEHRKAYEAYNDMLEHLDGFRITPANAEATLAPTVEIHEPADGDLVDSEGDGYIQFDTYCAASIPADQALTFDTEGDVTISNIHWIGTERANRIEFEWSGTGDFEVTGTARAEKATSWGAAIGEGHKLDGNGVAPNGDDYEFSFESRPKSVLFVIDDTGSMGNEIAGVKVALHNLIDSLEASGEPILYTLITFKDYVEYRGQTQDHDKIRTWVTALSATGGGDCPEESCDALLMGASVAPHSEAWWMTDADVHGGWANLAYVRAVLWFAGVRLHSVIMGSCSYDALGHPIAEHARSPNDPNDVCDTGPNRDQVNSYDAAQYLSEGTGGLYFPVSSNQVQDATEICLEEMTETTACACVYDCAGPGTHSVPIDGTCTEARFLVNPLDSSYPDVMISNPSGTPLGESDEGVSLLTAGGTQYLIVETPALVEGTWTVTTSGSVGDHVMRCSLATPVTFRYLGETAGAVGIPIDIVVDLDGNYPTPSFKAISIDGTTEHTVVLQDDGIHSDGAPNDGRYGGSFTASETGTYRVMTTGVSNFCRVDPAKIYFGALSVSASGDRFVAPGDSIIHTFTIGNLSDQTETYELAFDSSMGWAELSELPPAVDIDAHSSYAADVTVRTPDTTFNGEQDVLTLSAVQESNPLVSTTATVRTTAWSGPLIDSITPHSVVRGDVITIAGQRFGEDPGAGSHSTQANNVTIGSLQLHDAAIVSWGAESIQALIPHGAGSGEQSVYVSAGGVASNSFEVFIEEGSIGLGNGEVFFWPNPYNPDTHKATISYSLIKAADVTLRIFDSSGRLVTAIIENSSRPAGARQTETWNGCDDSGSTVANGVYFYAIETSEGEKTVGIVAVLR